jgi:hypothetical protein
MKIMCVGRLVDTTNYEFACFPQKKELQGKLYSISSVCFLQLPLFKTTFKLQLLGFVFVPSPNPAYIEYIPTVHANKCN